MKRILLIAAIAISILAGLSGCAVEATTYPDYYYYGPEVRTRVYYDMYPRYRYHYRRYYYTPRHYHHTPRRGHGDHRRSHHNR